MNSITAKLMHKPKNQILLLDILIIFSLLLIMRVGILPNHLTRFISLHPCREESGIYIILPMIIVFALIAIFLYKKFSKKISQKIYNLIFLAFLGLGIGITLWETTTTASYQYRINSSYNLEALNLDMIFFPIAALVISLFFLAFKSKNISKKWIHLFGWLAILSTHALDAFFIGNRGVIFPIYYMQLFPIVIIFTALIYFTFKENRSKQALIIFYELSFILLSFVIHFGYNVSCGID